jgi:transcriptional regulator with XRE-family HTH domain
MTSVGVQLKAAREARNCTPADVAQATHIKVQVIEQIERDDFSAMPAPIYARGFIRMYAQFVGLDPAPLLEEYERRTAPPAPAAPAEVPPPEPVAAPRIERPPFRAPGTHWREIVQPCLSVARGVLSGATARLRGLRLPRTGWLRSTGRWVSSLRISVSAETLQYAALAVAAFVVLVLIVGSVTRCSSARHVALPVESYQAREPLRLTHPPPDPYLDRKPAR